MKQVFHLRLTLLAFFALLFVAAVAQPACTLCTPNILTGGDFSGSCNTGYSSDLYYVSCSNSGAVGTGNFVETTDASLLTNVWQGLEHTGNGGRCMLFDGPQTDMHAWYQSVNVAGKHEYCFSAWVKNACIVCGGDPILQLRYYTPATGSVVLVTDTLPRNTMTWTQLSATFVAPSSPVEVSVWVLGGTVAGHDGMIDDISLGLACAQVSTGPDSHGLYPSPVFPNFWEKSQPVELSYQSLSNQTLTIEVVNMAGQVVVSETQEVHAGGNLLKINVGILEEGIYLISIQSEQGLSITKVVIE